MRPAVDEWRKWLNWYDRSIFFYAASLNCTTGNAAPMYCCWFWQLPLGPHNLPPRIMTGCLVAESDCVCLLQSDGWNESPAYCEPGSCKSGCGGAAVFCRQTSKQAWFYSLPTPFPWQKIRVCLCMRACVRCEDDLDIHVAFNYCSFVARFSEWHQLGFDLSSVPHDSWTLGWSGLFRHASHC